MGWIYILEYQLILEYHTCNHQFIPTTVLQCMGSKTHLELYTYHISKPINQTIFFYHFGLHGIDFHRLIFIYTQKLWLQSLIYASHGCLSVWFTSPYPTLCLRVSDSISILWTIVPPSDARRLSLLHSHSQYYTFLVFPHSMMGLGWVIYRSFPSASSFERRSIC